jgi:hypothetical protein
MPNPASQAVTLAVMESLKGDARIVIHDAAGREVYAVRYAEQAAQSLYQIPIAELAGGIYTVRFFQDRFSASERLVITD